MSQSESSDEEPDFLWLQPRTAGRMERKEERERAQVKKERREQWQGEGRKKHKLEEFASRR